MIFCYKKCKGRITNWLNRIVPADANNDVEPNPPPPISLFVDTSINRPVTNLMIESDQEEQEGDEEDPYSNIGGLSPINMHSNIPQPVTESNPSPSTSPLPQTSSSVVMLSDDEQETDEEQGYMKPVQSSSVVGERETDKNTPVPSSNTLQFPKQLANPQKLKTTINYMSRRFSARILNKQKSSDNKEQDIMDKAMEKKKKDLEMLPISKPLTPVAQAVTDRLYNEAKISKGGPVKKSNSKTTTKATRGRGRPRKIPQLILVLSERERERKNKSLYLIEALY